jgi:hypothetical protein
MPAWPDIDMRHARACGSAHRDAPLRMSRIPERVDGTRQTCDASRIRQTSRGGGTKMSILITSAGPGLPAAA